MENRRKIIVNNKGFSLIELIIVIAIMAVLIGVLAPAYLRYVEHSRKSRDIQSIDTVMRAIETIAADPQYQLQANDNLGIFLYAFAPGYEIPSSFCTRGTGAHPQSDLVKRELDATVPGFTLTSAEWEGVDFVIRGIIDVNGDIKWRFEGPSAPAIRDYTDWGTDVDTSVNTLPIT